MTLLVICIVLGVLLVYWMTKMFIKGTGNMYWLGLIIFGVLSYFIYPHPITSIITKLSFCLIIILFFVGLSKTIERAE